MQALRKALTGLDDGRVVILIDGLDRCHPEYTIRLLEAMKLVFAQKGFVFVLMVNANYLETLAAHRFGEFEKGERYLEKFVNLRLSLTAAAGQLGEAARHLASDLPLAIPFGENSEFTVERAAQLAADLAQTSDLSFRQIKRLLEKVEIALRCYQDRPLDCPLLVLLAFRDATGKRKDLLFGARSLPRGLLDARSAMKIMQGQVVIYPSRLSQSRQMDAREYVLIKCAEMIGLEGSIGLNEQGERILSDDISYLCSHILPTYLTSHERILDAVEALQAPRSADP
ncbi:hypothetical protein J4E08_16120 [Sagittula sp. NFXS13]|uniref:P-loop NTPase fold protein n=1 Tax=Sagittula sp. NFXS13 TaxID=2819095 RepID=UPI0032DFF6D7